MTNKLPWYGYVHSSVPLTIKKAEASCIARNQVETLL